MVSGTAGSAKSTLAAQFLAGGIQEAGEPGVFVTFEEPPVESYGAIKRGLAVLKMRGSPHDRNIREFMIDGEGMHIGDSFRHVTGLLAGRPEYGDPTAPGTPSDLVG